MINGMRAVLVWFACVSCVLGVSYAHSFDEATQNLINGNYKRALQIFENLCMGGDSGACYQLGILYSDGENVPRNFHKSVAFYDQACSANVLAACNNLGVMFYRGEGVRQDYQKSLELYDKACKGGNADACNNLGVMFENGYGVDNKDYVQAGLYYTDACMGKSAKGCYNLAVLVYEGKVGKKDRAMAKEYYGLSCDFGLQAGCDEFKKLNLGQ